MYFGRVAARFDDILNWIPARITFVLFVISAFFYALMLKGIQIGLRDAKKHPRPNGGMQEAPVAGGALHIRLGGYNPIFQK